MKSNSWIVTVLLTAGIIAAGYLYWQRHIASRLPEGIVSSNGRIEADQINIATKYAGRVLTINVDEGDTVDAGQVVARMETAELDARIRGAEAQVRRAVKAKVEADTSVVRARSRLELAKTELKRAQQLHDRGFATTEKRDQLRNEAQAAEAAYRGAVAVVDQSGEMIISAREDLVRLQTMLDDTVLKAPRRGRIQYRLAEPGEVLAAGGSILTLLDITDLYMTVFLPAAEAARLAIGSDARIILDPVPQYVIPAKVTFVSSQAQFTPKAVETKEERAKLVFRVKLKIDPDLLKKYEDRVKTGVRGIAYLRLPEADEWPQFLHVALPK